MIKLFIHYTLYLLFLLQSNFMIVLIDGYMNDAQEKQMLDILNDIRNKINNPPAANMNLVVTDRYTSKIAQRMADNCIFRGKSQTFMRSSEAQTAIIWLQQRKSTEPKPNATEAYKEWLSSKPDYKYPNTCSAKRGCHHYRSLIYGKTLHFGCGDCETSKNGLTQYYLYCVFYPGIRRTNPLPYISGMSCSKCPADLQGCDRNMCANGTAPIPSNITTKTSTTSPTTTTKYKSTTKTSTISPTTTSKYNISNKTSHTPEHGTTSPTTTTKYKSTTKTSTISPITTSKYNISNKTSHTPEHGTSNHSISIKTTNPTTNKVIVDPDSITNVSFSKFLNESVRTALLCYLVGIVAYLVCLAALGFGNLFVYLQICM